MFQDDAGLTVIEILIALMVLSVVAFVASTAFLQPRTSEQLAEVRKFLRNAQLEALTEGEGVIVRLEPGVLSREQHILRFDNQDLRIRIDQIGSSGWLVIFPSGAYSSKVTAADHTGEMLDLAPVRALPFP